MKRILLLIVMIVLGVIIVVRFAPPRASIVPDPLISGDYTVRLTHDGKDRFYLLHVPENVQSSAPLVVALHGGTGSAKIQAEAYGWTEKSDKEGFIVAFPNGVSRLPGGQLATWNVGKCCGYAKETESDDVGFIRAVVEDVKNKTTIGKVFATGMSNGGMMSYRLACEAADVFAGIGTVAGTDNTETCNPTVPVSVFHIHSQLDDRVPYNGGCGDYCRAQVDYTSVPDTIAAWVRRNGCNAAPTTLVQNERLTCQEYRGCDNGSMVKTCITEDGGHSWPGVNANPNPLEKSRGSTALNATDEIWAFFESL